MKTIRIITGVLIFFYHLLTPIAFWGIIAIFIWGPEVWSTPGKENPSNLFFMILVPPSIILAARHYVYNEFMPNVAVLIPRKYVGDEISIQTWLSWVQKSKQILQVKLNGLEEYERKLTEPEN